MPVDATRLWPRFPTRQRSEAPFSTHTHSLSAPTKLTITARTTQLHRASLGQSGPSITYVPDAVLQFLPLPCPHHLLAMVQEEHIPKECSDYTCYCGDGGSAGCPEDKCMPKGLYEIDACPTRPGNSALPCVNPTLCNKYWESSGAAKCGAQHAKSDPQFVGSASFTEYVTGVGCRLPLLPRAPPHSVAAGGRRSPTMRLTLRFPRAAPRHQTCAQMAPVLVTSSEFCRAHHCAATTSNSPKCLPPSTANLNNYLYSNGGGEGIACMLYVCVRGDGVVRRDI